MTSGFDAFSLGLFTSLAPAGVVAFLALALVRLWSRDRTASVRIDRMIALPFSVVLIGFIASATHLGTPANALHVFSGVGRSPLSNEVLSAVAFLFLVGSYWMMAFKERFPDAVAKPWLALACLAGIALIACTSMAYNVDTVPTWDTAFTPANLVLAALLAGPVLGLLFLELAQVRPRALERALVVLAAPALVAGTPLRGYVNIPGLGGLDINVSGNLSIDKILYPRNGKLVTLLDSSVSTADALSGLKADNLLGLDTRVNLIGFGAFTRNHKNFWSFDLNARVTTDATLPYSLFDFLKRGNSGDISDIGITADSYLEAGFNYSFPLLDDKLYIGVRAKFLMGVARARMYFTQFNVSHNEERWLINAAGGLDITAAGLDVKTELNDHGEEVYKMDDISLKPTSPAGYGFAVDFGATYDILPNLQASLAVNDLGFIGWSKNKNVTGYSAKELSFTGVTVTEDGTESPDFDIDVLEFHKGAAKSVSRMLRASINAGLEYEVWRHKIGIGLLYTARVWEYKTLHNITGSVNFHPIRWFTVTGSYSVIDNRGGAVGLALNLNPSWINFYLATDIVTAKHTPQFIPIKQSVMNVTLGIGVPIGRRSHRIAAYVYDKDRR